MWCHWGLTGNFRDHLEQELRKCLDSIDIEDKYDDIKNKIKKIFKEKKELVINDNESRIDNFINSLMEDKKFKKEKDEIFHLYKDNIELTKEKIENEKEYSNFIYRLININNSVDSYSQLVNLIEKLSKKNAFFFKSIRIFDNCQASLFPFSKENNQGILNKTNYKILQNLVNINHYFKYLKSSTIDRVYIFMDFILAVEKMYYQEEKFFKLEKENIFLDLKTKNVKIISFYQHFEKNFDWNNKFSSMSNSKIKEEFLKNFFMDFRKICLNNGNLVIKMDENGFSYEGENHIKKNFWKNKHIFLFDMVKKYLHDFLKSAKKSNIFGFENMSNNRQKHISTLEKVKNFLIYLFSNSRKDR